MDEKFVQQDKLVENRQKIEHVKQELEELLKVFEVSYPADSIFYKAFYRKNESFEVEAIKNAIHLMEDVLYDINLIMQDISYIEQKLALPINEKLKEELQKAKEEIIKRNACYEELE